MLFRIRRLSIVVSIFLTFFIIGCVTVEKKGETTIIDPWKKMEERIGEFFAKLKGETTEEQNYTEHRGTKENREREF